MGDEAEQPVSPNAIQPEHAVRLNSSVTQRVEAILLLITEYWEHCPKFSDPRRQAVDFLRSCPGCVIRIPALRELEEVLKRDQIVRAWQHDHSKERRKSLSELHDVPVKHFKQYEKSHERRQAKGATRKVGK